MQAIRLLGLAAIAGLAVTVIPMLLGIAYAIRPTERWLALMRPLTLAAIFAAIANTFLGLANVFQGLSRITPASPPGLQFVMLAEVSVVPFVSFTSLALAWLCIAFGIRRVP